MSTYLVIYAHTPSLQVREIEMPDGRRVRPDNAETIGGALNRFADEGWELADSVSHSGSNTTVFILRR